MLEVKKESGKLVWFYEKKEYKTYIFLVEVRWNKSPPYYAKII